jgi:NADH-quinone oxidoreductase subunit F
VSARSRSRAASLAEAGWATRHQLLPVLHALQARAGWISPGGLRYACERLTVPPAEAYGVATFYAMFSTEERPARVVHVCDDIACRVAGAVNLIGDLERELGPERENQLLRSPCLGMCERAPAARAVIRGGSSDSALGHVNTFDLAAIARGEQWSIQRSFGRPSSQGRFGLKRVGVVDPSSPRRLSGPRWLRIASARGVSPRRRHPRDEGCQALGEAALRSRRGEVEAVAKQSVRPHYSSARGRIRAGHVRATGC